MQWRLGRAPQGLLDGGICDEKAVQWALGEGIALVNSVCAVLADGQCCSTGEYAPRSVMGLVVQTRLAILDRSPKV